MVETASTTTVVASSAWPEARFPFQDFNDIFHRSIRRITNSLKVPVLYSNNCGPVDYNLPLFTRFAREFLGGSGLYSFDRKEVLGKDAGIVVVEV